MTVTAENLCARSDGDLSRSGDLLNATPFSRLTSRYDLHDIATVALLVLLAVIALGTFGDYAISNDEGVQHHYGQLILEYYRSGLTDTTVFGFRDLYLYGGLFDIVSVALSQILSVDPFDLRHILCPLIGIAGIGAAAATARMIAGPRSGLIAAIALSVCGCWYGGMFNHTKDIPLGAAMAGASFYLIRCGRALPCPRRLDIILFGLLTGAALGIRVHAPVSYTHLTLPTNREV